MITFEAVEQLRQAIPPRQAGDDDKRSSWGWANTKFERAVKRYEAEHGESWFSRPDWDYNLHGEI